LLGFLAKDCKLYKGLNPNGRHSRIRQAALTRALSSPKHDLKPVGYYQTRIPATMLNANAQA